LITMNNEKPTMPPENFDIYAWLIARLQAEWSTIYAGFLGCSVAALRVLYGGGSFRQVLLEAPLCGAISLATSSGLDFFGIAQSAAPFFGGVIGLLGVEGVRRLADRYLSKKVEDAR